MEAYILDNMLFTIEQLAEIMKKAKTKELRDWCLKQIIELRRNYAKFEAKNK